MLLQQTKPTHQSVGTHCSIPPQMEYLQSEPSVLHAGIRCFQAQRSNAAPLENKQKLALTTLRAQQPCHLNISTAFMPSSPSCRRSRIASSASQASQAMNTP